MKQALNITVKEAAALLNADERWVRDACKRNILGDAYSKNGRRYTIKISDGKLLQWLGWTAEELENTVRELRRTQ